MRSAWTTRLLTAGSFGVLAVLVVLLPGRRYLPTDVLLIDVTSSFAVQWSVLALVMGGWMLLRRRWLRGVAFILLLVPELSGFMPSDDHPPVVGRPITVVSANLFESTGAVRAAVAEAEALDADLLWWSEFPRDLDPETRGRVGALDARYPFGFEISAADGRDLRFLSRFPLRSRETFEPPQTRGRPALKLTLEVQGRLLTVFALHTHPPTSSWSLEARNATLDWVAEQRGSVDGYVMVLGDLNTSAFAPRFREFIANTELDCGSPWRCAVASWPSFMPLLLTPIDHILVGGGAEVVSLRRGRFTGSDHFPVVAEVAFGP